MGPSTTERRDREAEAAGVNGTSRGDDQTAFVCGNGGPESAGTSVGLTVTQDRVLIRADREEHAPEQTDNGLYLAKSLAAAVDGSDAGESWFTGTIVQLGPLVNRLDVREHVLGWLWELEHAGHDLVPAEIKALRAKVQALPAEHIDAFSVGQRVVFSWASGQQIAIGHDRYVMLRVDDILGIVEED